jgi:hypothetical protein
VKKKPEKLKRSVRVCRSVAASPSMARYSSSLLRLSTRDSKKLHEAEFPPEKLVRTSLGEELFQTARACG